ncbi:MAG: sialidase family protein [Candidatus Latescibacterota bacterium]
MTVTAAAPAPRLRHLEHGVLHHDPGWYCGHPRQAVFGHFPGDELVVGHNHAPCAYAAPQDVRHDLGGYHSRAVALLQRSCDQGRAWPAAEEVVVYDETRPEAWKHCFLYGARPPRPGLDMFHPDALFYFGRTYLPESRGRTAVCFCLRSGDRGRTWESTPGVVEHPEGAHLWVHKDCHPVVRLARESTLLAAMSLGQDTGGGPGLYASTDHGLTWQCRTRIARTDSGRYTYLGLLLLPDGRLQCYALHIAPGDGVEGVSNAICVCTSLDQGDTWGPMAPIVGGEETSWPGSRGSGKHYRSPWPILLGDGRILVLFARRRLPMGIGAVVSADGGRTWSREAVIRADAGHPDLGYPVGCQLTDGSVFVAYYYNLPSPGPVGGVRFIASSRFELD